MSEETGPTALPDSGRETRCPEVSGCHHDQGKTAKSYKTRRRQAQHRGRERWGSKLHTQQTSVLGNGQVSSLLVVYTVSLGKVRI